METLLGFQNTFPTQITDSINPFSHQTLMESFEKMLDEKIDNFLEEIKSQKSNTNLVTDNEELKEYIKAIRRHQINEIYKVYEYPPLFMIYKERVNDNLLAKTVDKVRENIVQYYRMYFFCSVCGKAGYSGQHEKREESKYFFGRVWDRIQDSIAITDKDQGGYRLSIPDETFLKVLTYLKWVLQALEIASKVAGLPMPNLSFLIEDLPHSDGLMKETKKFSKKLIPNTQNVLQATRNVISQGGESKETINQHTGNDQNQNITNTNQILLQMSQEDFFDCDNDNDSDDNSDTDQDDQITERERLKKYWLNKKPTITWEEMKIIQELLREVKDPSASSTGLRRCYREEDGTIAWVCEDSEQGNDNETKQSNDTSKLSCYDLYRRDGQKCCVVNLKLK